MGNKHFYQHKTNTGPPACSRKLWSNVRYVDTLTRTNIMNSTGVSWFFSTRHWVCFRDWDNHLMTFSPRFHFSHWRLRFAILRDKQDLKNIDDRTMDSLNYYETLFTYFEVITKRFFYLFWSSNCFDESKIKNALAENFSCRREPNVGTPRGEHRAYIEHFLYPWLKIYHLKLQNAITKFFRFFLFFYCFFNILGTKS